MSQEPQVILRAGSAGPVVVGIGQVLGRVMEGLGDIEATVIEEVPRRLAAIHANRDRVACDAIFGAYLIETLLGPYSNLRLDSRAAAFCCAKLIPKVLSAEQANLQFHKGALFYNAGLSCLAAGDEGRFEYLLAMADEEDYRTAQVEGQVHRRGITNVKTGDLRTQTITHRLQSLAEYLNDGAGIAGPTFEELFGYKVDHSRIEQWRGALDPYHHYELLRLVGELDIFRRGVAPNYQAVLDNPYVMLRLCKLLAHLAQWVESDLTLLQAGAHGNTLARKLNDPHLSGLKAIASPKTLILDGMSNLSVAQQSAALKQLLQEIANAGAIAERQWRVLRILYIVRNATAHTIDPMLDFYTDRGRLLSLIRVVLLSAFILRQRKGQAIP